MENSSYLNPETLSRLSGLELKARGIVDGYLSGMHRSPHQGFSVEFAEHREYTPGDDLRYVDWKVYGKRDRHYLKRYEEETNFVCELLLDVSDSMRFRSDTVPLSKLEYGKCVVAALTYLILRQQDAVGLATFAGDIESCARASGRAAQLKQVVQVLESIPDAAGSRPLTQTLSHGETMETESGPPFATPLHALAERLPRRSLVVVLSDFFCELEGLHSALQHFRHSRHDVILMQIVDPAEQEFPYDQPVILQDLESRAAEMIDPRSLAATYRQEFEQFQYELRSLCGQLEFDYLCLRTDHLLAAPLAAYLARRQHRPVRST
jgi:uncharacterized protein (DUF58 family)